MTGSSAGRPVGSTPCASTCACSSPLCCSQRTSSCRSRRRDDPRDGRPHHRLRGRRIRHRVCTGARRTVGDRRRGGPWVDPDALEPFSLEEMDAKYRHGGLSARWATLASRMRKAAASAEAPRSTAASTTACQRSWPMSGASATRSTSSHLKVLTATPNRSSASCRCRSARRSASVVGRARARRHEARVARRRVQPRVPQRTERASGEADDGAHLASPRSKPAHR